MSIRFDLTEEWVNTRLRPERKLAQVYRIERFAHQATLSRSLDRLSLTNLTELEQAVRAISQQCSRTRRHDWRGFLALDFDLSGLPCGKQAQGSQKGYFSGKKHDWPTISPGQRHQLSGNLVVWPVCRQSDHGHLLETGRLGGRNFVRLSR